MLTVLLWLFFAIVLFVLALLLGVWVRKQPSGILVDNRGRYSLAQFQMVTWTIVVLSLITAVFVARLLGPSPATALEFTVPRTLLLVMGISLGSLAGSAVIKGTKDQMRPASIAASNDQDRPRWWQLFTLEEGALADKAVDIGKFQNFWLTVILVTGYVAMTVSWLSGKSPDAITTLPDFSESMVTLLAHKSRRVPCEQASQSRRRAARAYGAKRDAGFLAQQESATAAPLAANEYIPRNRAPKKTPR